MLSALEISFSAMPVLTKLYTLQKQKIIIIYEAKTEPTNIKELFLHAHSSQRNFETERLKKTLNKIILIKMI